MISFNKKKYLFWGIEKTKNGYALLELLFYISFFVVLCLLVIDAMVVMAGSFRETTINAEWAQSGNIMERISREIRGAVSISTLNTTDLILNTKDSGGGNKTVEFSLSGANLQLIENGTLTGNLNTPKIVVTGISFSQITTTQGKAVKVFLTLRSTDDSLNRVKNFYDTIVLRGIY